MEMYASFQKEMYGRETMCNEHGFITYKCLH